MQEVLRARLAEASIYRDALADLIERHPEHVYIHDWKQRHVEAKKLATALTETILQFS